MEEIQSAVEIVKMPLEVGGQTVEVAARVMSEGINSMISLVKFVSLLQEQLKREQFSGETNLEELLQETKGDIQTFQFSEEHYAEVKDAFMKFGVRFAEAPDLNTGDGMREFFIPTNALPRVNTLAEKLQKKGVSCGILSNTDYVDNADPEHQKEMEEMASALGTGDVRQKPDGKETKPEQEAMKERLVYGDLLQDKTKQLFTINEKLKADESDTHFVMRVPYTEHFVRFDKELSFLRDEGKTYCCFVDKNETLDILDKKGNVIRQMPAHELYKLHYNSSLKQKVASVKKGMSQNPVNKL